MNPNHYIVCTVGSTQYQYKAPGQEMVGGELYDPWPTNPAVGLRVAMHLEQRNYRKVPAASKLVVLTVYQGGASQATAPTPVTPFTPPRVA